MTEYQLKVLREVDGERGSVEISRAIHGGYANAVTYVAMERLRAAGLISSAWFSPSLGKCFHRTPAGDAALANADGRLLPREPIQSRLF